MTGSHGDKRSESKRDTRAPNDLTPSEEKDLLTAKEQIKSLQQESKMSEQDRQTYQEIKDSFAESPELDRKSAQVSPYYAEKSGVDQDKLNKIIEKSKKESLDES